MQNMAYLQRLKFDELQERYKQYGVEVQPSYLRYEKQLQNGVNHYPFAFEPSPNDSVTEKKLNKNDLFYVTSFTYGYIVMGTTTPATEGETARTISEANAPLHTFATDNNLEALYNGFINITTGSKINIEQMSTLNFKYVPVELTPAVTVPEFQNDKVAFANVSDLLLAGTKSHKIELNIPPIPAGENLIPAEADAISNPNVKVVLQLNGFLLKNGAIIAQMENF
jgi:hypothetical protein